MNSVVMTTYNGARYLSEQLESLMAQEVLPDEIIVADDCSMDASYEIVRAFAAAHPLIEWRVYRNEQNLGWKRNFKEAIGKASGEFIYLCDQDDVWTSNHIAGLWDAMQAHSEIDVMTSHAEPFYEEGAFEPNSVDFECSESGRVATIQADKRYLLVRAPGCTYCLRRTFVESLMPYWPNGVEHDAFLYASSCLKGGLGYLDTTTLRFRRHADNASDERTKNRDESVKLLDGFLQKNQAIREWLLSLNPSERARLEENGIFDLLDCTDSFTRGRITALKHPSVVSLCRLVLHADMYATRRNMLGDFACALFPHKDWHR